MLSSKAIRSLGFGAAAAMMLVLGGCSGLTPVYGERGIGAERIALSYGAPTSRLDQIVYQQLALRFGPDAGPDAPRVEVSTSLSSTSLTRTPNPNPQSTVEAIVVATAVITDPAGVVEPIVLRRTASAQFTTGSQLLANNSAADDAAERAARAAAESLRLAIFAALSS